MNSREKVIFLTGATGLIGSYLSKMLLQSNYKVYVLARSREEKNAKERLIECLKFWDEKILQKIDKLIVLEGDISNKNLDLDCAVKDMLSNEVEEIFHCAAATQFSLPLTELRKSNVEGTKNILDIGFEWNIRGRLKKINYLSTIYICGDHKGVFKENDLEVRQKFNTTYEQSKFEAEKLVMEYRRKGLWIDVFRPPAVSGETMTGKTFMFTQALYQALRIWNLEIFDYFPGEKNYCIDTVFVDDLCKSILCISSQASIRNNNYHTFSSKPPSINLEEILTLFSNFLGTKKPELIPPQEFLKNKSTSIQKMLLMHNFFFLNNNAKLDAVETNEFLKKYGFEFSNLNEELFLKLLEYGVKVGFLKKKNKSFSIRN